MLLQPTHELTIDCLVDVDFAGQWNVKIHMTLFVSTLSWDMS